MTNRLIFVRHGQSTGNEDHAMYKYPDSAVSLTTLGIKQAINAGNNLSSLIASGYFNWHWNDVHAFVSCFTRAKQTARIVLDVMKFKHVQPIESPGINERRQGNKKGLVITEEQTKDPDWRPGPGGESMTECRNRFAKWFKYNAEFLLTDSDVILFMHGELMMAAQAHILNLSNTAIFSQPSWNAVPIIYERDPDTGIFTASPHKFSKLDPTAVDVIR